MSVMWVSSKHENIQKSLCCLSKKRFTFFSWNYTFAEFTCPLSSVALLSHNDLKWSAILGLRVFARCWRSRESMLQNSSTLSEFHASLSKVLTLWHCVKAKQRYQICVTLRSFAFEIFRKCRVLMAIIIYKKIWKLSMYKRFVPSECSFQHQNWNIFDQNVTTVN